MSRVLILSTTTGYQLRSFGDAARDLGVDLVFATDRCFALDDPWRDAAIPVRFHDEARSLAAIERAGGQRAIDGVLAVGDRPVVLAARAAEALGVPGNAPDAARATTDKRLARARLLRGGLPVPWFVEVQAGADIDALARELPYPVVIKPVGLSGSRGVIRADSRRDLTAAHARVSALLARREIRARRTGLERDLLIEEYIEGQEYAVEGLVDAGGFRALAVFDKPDPLEGPFFEETIYVTPSAAPPPVQAAILDAIGRAVAALGLQHGPVHAECRVNGRGVFVLEIAARPIGGLCSRILRFDAGAAAAVGAGDDGPAVRATVSLEHLLLRHALGEDVTRVRREDRAAAVMMIPIPRRGIFKSVSGEEEARAVPGIDEIRMTAKRDQLLEPLPEAGSYLGFIFARARTPARAEAALREAHGRLRLSIDSAIDLQIGPTAEPAGGASPDAPG